MVSTSAAVRLFRVLFGLLCSHAILAEDLFPARVFSVGKNPWQIATADFNLDGHPDLVVANYESEFLSVLLGAGDGTFSSESQVPAGIGTKGILPIDLDRDGRTDLALASLAGVSVRLGNGDGTFAEAVDYPTFEGMEAIASADFNGDNRPDLVAGGGNRIALFFGNGDGTLVPGPSSVGGALSVVAGDFNHDGTADYLRIKDSVRIVPGVGDGTFGPDIAVPVADHATDAVANDFNGDDRLDLAVFNGDAISILLSLGGGLFASEVRYQTIADARFMTSGDLDRDGDEDLLVSQRLINRTPELAVLLSNGDGTFGPENRYRMPLLGGDAVTGDFDGDGRLDVAVASLLGETGSKSATADSAVGCWLPGCGMVFVLEGDGQGQFLGETVERFRVGDQPSSVVVGDFDGDGVLDAATANYRSADVSFVLGVGDGTFTEQVRFPVGTSPSALVGGLFDAGSDLDLAVANRGSSEISILLGNGGGTFVSVSPVPLARAPTDIVRGDLDGNGTADLATANYDTSDVSVLLGHGDGTFEPPAHLAVGAGPAAIEVADLDGLGGLDLAVVNYGSGDVSILLGHGDGTFAAEARLPVGASLLRSIAAGDVNGDGMTDLVVVGGGVPSARVLYGDGLGGVASQELLGVTTSAVDVGVGDLNRDGQQDIMIAHVSPMVSVLLGREGGAFEPRREFAASKATSSGLASGDLDLDGRLDLLVVDSTWDRVSVLLNQLPPYLRFDSDKETLTWRIRLGVDSYNVYRGGLADLVDVDGDGLVENGYGVCMTGLDPDPTDNVFVDAEVPPPGGGFFYLMALVDEHGESGLGETSTGQPRFPAVPCTQVAQRRAVAPAGIPAVVGSMRSETIFDERVRQSRLRAGPATGRGPRR